MDRGYIDRETDSGEEDLTLFARVVRLERLAGLNRPGEYSNDVAGEPIGRTSSTLDAIAMRIGASIGNIEGVAERLEVAGERILGSRPESDGGAGEDKRRVPDCAVDRIMDALRELEQTISRADSAADRLISGL